MGTHWISTGWLERSRGANTIGREHSLLKSFELNDKDGKIENEKGNGEFHTKRRKRARMKGNDIERKKQLEN